jgi:hypothetical protein
MVLLLLLGQMPTPVHPQRDLFFRPWSLGFVNQHGHPRPLPPFLTSLPGPPLAPGPLRFAVGRMASF